MTPKTRKSPESVVKEIKRRTRRKFNSEEKIRIILEGLKGEDSKMQSVTKRGSPHDLHITKEYRGLLPGFFSKDHLDNWHDHLVNYRRKKCRTRMGNEK